MKVIWTTEFRCKTCKKTIVGNLVSDTEEAIPRNEKSRGVEHLRRNHETESRSSCWECNRQIETHEIENLVWANDSWQDLCTRCI